MYILQNVLCLFNPPFNCISHRLGVHVHQIPLVSHLLSLLFTIYLIKNITSFLYTYIRKETESYKCIQHRYSTHSLTTDATDILNPLTEEKKTKHKELPWGNGTARHSFTLFVYKRNKTSGTVTPKKKNTCAHT